MLFEYEVLCDGVETGLVLGRGEGEENMFADAIKTLVRYYGVEMEKVSLSPFAPDEPLKVSKNCLNEIAKDVIW